MRKRTIAIAGFAAVALSAGPLLSGVRSKGVRATAISSKSSQALAECVALKLAQSKGYEIRDSGQGNPRDIQLLTRILGVAAVVGIVAIEDAGAERKMSTFATGKADGAPAVLTQGALSCATS